MSRQVAYGSLTVSSVGEPMRKLLVVLAVVAGVMIGAGGTALAGESDVHPHIVGVSGNRLDGFRVHWSNGWTDRTRDRASSVDRCLGSGSWRNASSADLMCRTRVEDDFYWMMRMRQALRHAG